MKKLSLFLVKSLMAVFVGTTIISCNGEHVERIESYPISKITMFERNSIQTYLTYQSNEVYEYNLYENGVHFSSARVTYTPSKIHCTIDGIRYDIQLSNTIGAYRAETVTASQGGSMIYFVEYKYDNQGRMVKARLDGRERYSVFTEFTYEANAIVIDDGGYPFRLELSSSDNIGNVCNVIDMATTPYVSTIINPYLYYLNIYGKPINKLPQGYEIELSEDGLKLSSIGKYYFEY